jgi:hypothetical protein
MLSDEAISYAVVDLFEFDAVQLSNSGDAVRVMTQAGVPCTLAREGEHWTVRLGADFVKTRARRAEEDSGGPRLRLITVA